MTTMVREYPAKGGMRFFLIRLFVVIVASTLLHAGPNQTVALAADAQPSIDQSENSTTQVTPAISLAPSSPAQLALPHDLSPWGMFLAADIVVKSIMVGLALASFLVWTVWLGKLIQVLIARRTLRAELKAIVGQKSIDDAARQLGRNHSIGRAMLDAAQRELQTANAQSRFNALERITTRLGEIESDANRAVRGGMSFLATVGATAPFIGLLGTVWGIMNSFVGIAKTQTTNLAVVAPGIAEALLATAIGLVAAIPAVILYNHLGQGMAGFKRQVRETKGEVGRIASRHIEHLSAERSLARLHIAAE